MVNKRFYTIFMSVLIATLFFYASTTGAALAVNKLFLSENNFGKQTYIGSVNVSNLKEAEVNEVLSAAYDSLSDSFQAEIVYQDVTAELPLESVRYELQKTIDLAETGVENAIKATVSEDSLRTILMQQFSPVTFTDHEVSEIASGIEKELETGVMPIKVYISNFLSGNDLINTEISQASITLSSPSRVTNKLIEAINETKIVASSTFSLLEFLEDNYMGIIPDDELTVVASAIYATVLKTNFAIDERYIGETLHKDVPIGIESAINQHLGIDLKFTNVNQSTYVLKAKLVEQNLTVSLFGLPLIYSYDVHVGALSEFKPRTIEQYSAAVPSATMQVHQEGQNGQEVIVTKVVSHGIQEFVNKQISKDYYAPIHKIEVYPLIKKEESPASDLTNNDSSDEKTGNASADVSNDQGNSATNEDTSSDANSEENQSNNQSGTTVDKDQQYPRPSEDNDYEYDKGGNIIKGGGK